MLKLEELKFSELVKTDFLEDIYICARMPRLISFDPIVNTEYTNYGDFAIIAKRLNMLVVKGFRAFFINDS